MSKTIRINAGLVDQSNSNSITSAKTLTVQENAFVDLTFDLTTTETTLTYTNITSVGYVLAKCVSGSDVLVSVDGGSNYIMRLSSGMGVVLPINTDSLLETQTVTTVADVSGSLDGTYFVVEDNNGETWAIGDGTLSHSEDNEISVSTDLTDATAAEVAAAFYAEIVASSAFTALFSVTYNAATDDDFITITDKNTGTRTNIADTGSTGFTLATTQQGADVPDIRVKSEGTSVFQQGSASR